MINLQEVTLSRGNKILLNKATVSLHPKQKIGLVGRNGCGKSTLFSLLAGEITADHGECQLNAGIRISHLRQQLPDTTENALNYVLSGDNDYIRLKQKLDKAEKLEDDRTIIACHEELQNTGGYSKPAEAAKILNGLGFSADSHTNEVNSFSGGWRMRLSLAKCLMKPADLLLLDEPTNHLDMEAIFWLERWLSQSPSTIILISHDRMFLDAVVSHILNIEQKNLNLYKGNYSRFEQTRAEQLALQQATFDKQQKKIQHMMSFVSRFKAKASKAKQAQSRLKAINKIEITAQAQIDSPFSFEFFKGPKASNPLISCEQLSAGYDKNEIIINNINFSLNEGDRIALLGPNGQGKSTFIKTLTGKLQALSGNIHRSQNTAIGYYAQHQLEELDERMSPIQTIQQLSPKTSEQAIRDYLGGFDFSGEKATSHIKPFSGGEKARLALAKLIWQKPNVLLLDEPTNHLDMNMRSAIEIALQSYEGAMILISHDRYLISSTVDDFHLVYNHSLVPFTGDLDDYFQWLQKTNDLNNKILTGSNSSQYKQRKSMQNQLKRFEKILNETQKSLSNIENQLADTTLYEKEDKTKLNKLIKEKKQLQELKENTELDWLEVSEQLEKI